MGYDTPVKSQDPTSVSLLGINIRNPDNTIPSTGYVLTVSSGKAYMLESVAGAAFWSKYPAICTINAAGFALSSVSSVFVQQNLTVGSNVTATGAYAVAFGQDTLASGNYSFAEGQQTSSIGIASHSEGFHNIAFGSNSHVGGQNCSSIGIASYAHGASNSATGNFSGTLAGYCNITNAICATAVGQYANARNINAFTFAGMAHSTSSATYLGGTAQTFMMTLGGVMPTANTEVPMFFFGDTVGTTTSNINISILNANNYFCHTVNLDLTGYERVPVAGATAGNGIFAGTYRFFVYWDGTATPVVRIADRGGSKATSGGFVTLTAIDTTNMLSNGSATVTVKAYMVGNPTGANYSITAQSTGYPLNWLAQIRVGELMAAK
jgi:hypothetical protein